ncbi:MAG: MBL fold metallo-hydrolase [Promethearchaeota archaeon]
MPRLYRVLKNIFVLLPRTTTFLNANVNIIKSNKTALIDCGSVFDPGTKYLTKILRSLGINAIDYIIITHSHVDHCQNAGLLAERFGAEIIAHKNAKPILNQIGNISNEAFEYWELIEETYPRLLQSNLGWLFRRLIVLGYNYLIYGRGKNIEKVTEVEDGDVIDLGNINLEVLFTPGHSDDSICLLEKKKRIFFSGDMIPWSPYIHTNVEEFRFSISKILKTLERNDSKILVRGHQKPLNALVEKENYRKFLQDMIVAERRILKLLDLYEALTAQDMLPYIFHRTHFMHQVIYRIFMRTQLFWIKKYLQNLKDKKLIKCFKHRRKIRYALNVKF